MKKLILLLTISIIFASSLFSQQAIKYEIKVKYNNNSSELTADISVSVKSGNPNFTYYLMTNDPFNGEVLSKSDPTSKKNHVFKGVIPGKYFVKITDNQNLPAGKTIEIKANDSSN